MSDVDDWENPDELLDAMSDTAILKRIRKALDSAISLNHVLLKKEGDPYEQLCAESDYLREQNWDLKTELQERQEEIAALRESIVNLHEKLKKENES